ncbi:MAG: hypothetical protein OXM61_09655, partial [Candidatus Poribacteria bacterium]|nr:hypothetical protein [Candidatus Poribacteria bacterium]
GMSQEEANKIYLEAQSDLPEGMSQEEANKIYLEAQSDLKGIFEAAKKAGEEAEAAWLKMTPEERVKDYQEHIEEWESLISEMEANGEPVEWHRNHVAILKRYQEWEADTPRRLKEFEEGRRETEESLKKLDLWTRDMIEILKPIAHFEVEEIDGKINIISWDLNYDALQQRKMGQDTNAKQDAEPPASSITAEPAIRPQSENPVSTSDPLYDPVKSLSLAQTSLKSWRADLDAKYFDVVISQYFTPQEIDEYFQTPQERETLKSRTSEMQREVVSKIRKVVSEIPNATQTQKSKLARELVTANFDKDFADAVIEQLQLDQK